MTSLDKVILEIVETKQPRNVRELVQLVQEQIGASLDDITREVKNLEQKGRVVLEEPTPPSNRFIDFLSSRETLWFWITISLALLAFVSILFFPEAGGLLSYLRYAFGFVLAAFLPGYCLTEALFSKKNAIDEIERFTYSVGLSFAVTSLVGLFLSLTPIGLTLQTALLALGSIVIVLSLVSLNRKYRAEK
ncbi:MAG: DUF1616 domain-containing protein, partial [Candidatus Bathyarchaeota archaeon]